MVDGSQLKMEGKSEFFFTDTHAHLASSRFEGNLDEVLHRAREAGVRRIVSISCDLEDTLTNLDLSERTPGVFATAGVHPSYVHEVGQGDWLGRISGLAARPGVVAIGEIGLDHYHPPADGSPVEEWRRRQREVFEAMLQLANDLALPAVIHQRECAEEVMEVLGAFPRVRAVLHCFTGSRAQAERALEQGHHLSFTGVLTYKNSGDLRETVSTLPLDRIMIETDAPYLAPVPFRGKTCEPAHVVQTAIQLANLHGLALEEIARITSDNAGKFFGLRGFLD